jgi:hypothetical protein
MERNYIKSETRYIGDTRFIQCDRLVVGQAKYPVVGQVRYLILRALDIAKIKMQLD